MVAKKALRFSFVLYLLFLMGCSGNAVVVTEIPNHAPADTSISVVVPTASSTPDPLIHFMPGIPDDIEIVEQNIEINFDLSISDIPSDEYVMYTVNNSLSDSEVWIMLPDGNDKQRLFTCSNCLKHLESLYS